MGIPPLDPQVHCADCFERTGLRRPVVTAYRDGHYCEACVRLWVKGQRRIDGVMEALAKEIRRAKVASGFRSKEIARFVGVTPQMISLYMQEPKEGVTPVRPSLETFLRICEATKTRPDALTGFVDERLARTQEAERRFGLAIAKALEAFGEAGVYGGDQQARTPYMGRRSETDPAAAEREEAERDDASYL
jgi:transcriptional regulator with XRE-family HTH domain